MQIVQKRGIKSLICTTQHERSEQPTRAAAHPQRVRLCRPMRF